MFAAESVVWAVGAMWRLARLFSHKDIQNRSTGSLPGSACVHAQESGARTLALFLVPLKVMMGKSEVNEPPRWVSFLLVLYHQNCSDLAGGEKRKTQC